MVARADGTLLVDGLMPIDEFEAAVGVRGLAGDGGFDTVAGLVLRELGRIPTAGDRVDGVGPDARGGRHGRPPHRQGHRHEAAAAP